MALIPMPIEMLDRLTAPQTVSPARSSSSLVLTRDGADGLEVYLMRRKQAMAFAPGMCVFPGGSLHASDTDPSIGWVGPDREWWGERLDCEPALAQGLVCAAIRELFEETGVLLAGPDAESVCLELSDAEIQSARRILDEDRLSLKDFLAERDYLVRADLLHAWSRWVTPVFESRRFDTYFFVAAIPDGQDIGELSGEADHAVWMTIEQIERELETGTIAMLPPTRSTVRSLAGLATGDLAAAAARRSTAPIMPELQTIDGQLFLQTNELEEGE